MCKKRMFTFLCFWTIFLCSCSNHSDSFETTDSSKSDLFILEINTDDLNNVHALATYTGSEPVTILYSGIPIYFKVYDGNGKELITTMASSISNSMVVEPGDIIRGDLGGFSPTGNDEFLYYVLDETGYDMERRYNYISGNTYEFYAYFIYSIGSGSDVKLDTSVSVHIP